MAVLVNLVDCIRWQSIGCCEMPDIRILRKDVGTKSQDKRNKEKRYYSQISLLKLNNVLLSREILPVSASKYPGGNHLLTLQSFPGNLNNLPGNSD